MTEHHPAVRRFLEGKMNVDNEQTGVLVEGSRHPYQCRCCTCLAWWSMLGPEDGGSWGPFTHEEIRDHVAQKGQ